MRNSGTAPKLLHKYTGRALLVCTSACAMNCRFCFRQNFDYEKEDKSFEAELEAIRQDTTLTEIILSGGDPLSLSNELLHSLIDRLSAIPHLLSGCAFIRAFLSAFPNGLMKALST